MNLNSNIVSFNVRYFDHLDDSKQKMDDFENTLKQQGHTCVHAFHEMVGWCGYDICENNPKPALD